MSRPGGELEQLRAIVRAFVDERDWDQFHTPKNLAMALMVEAAELLELFQWLTPEESRSLTIDVADKERVADEIDDLFDSFLDDPFAAPALDQAAPAQPAPASIRCSAARTRFRRPSA